MGELRSSRPADEHGKPYRDELPATEIPSLEPVLDQVVRWGISWGEILSANPENLRSFMANMNEQIRRLYELRTMEMELGRALTPEEIDLTLHREKAGKSSQADL